MLMPLLSVIVSSLLPVVIVVFMGHHNHPMRPHSWHSYWLCRLPHKSCAVLGVSLRCRLAQPWQDHWPCLVGHALFNCQPRRRPFLSAIKAVLPMCHYSKASPLSWLPFLSSETTSFDPGFQIPLPTRDRSHLVFETTSASEASYLWVNISNSLCRNPQSFGTWFRAPLSKKTPSSNSGF